uniref:Glucose-6-phosphate isomerase n=1 Tax=Lepeophtheirus salmonis TaxID=72036 RepID=C1BVV7_LEPSM|nr:Glucose-6-phosphate isomerase [Lepeophtheirus salmonis]
MDGKGPLREDSAFKALQNYFDSNGNNLNIASLFKEDSERFNKYRFVIRTFQSYDTSLIFIIIYAYELIGLSQGDLIKCYTSFII